MAKQLGCWVLLLLCIFATAPSYGHRSSGWPNNDCQSVSSGCLECSYVSSLGRGLRHIQGSIVSSSAGGLGSENPAAATLQLADPAQTVTIGSENAVTASAAAAVTTAEPGGGFKAEGTSSASAAAVTAQSNRGKLSCDQCDSRNNFVLVTGLDGRSYCGECWVRLRNLQPTAWVNTTIVSSRPPLLCLRLQLICAGCNTGINAVSHSTHSCHCQ